MAGTLNAERHRSAQQNEAEVLQTNMLRPRSNDVRRNDPLRQAFAASVLALETVTLGEEEISGAMAVDEAAGEEGEEQEQGIAGDEVAEAEGKSSNGASLSCLWPRRSKITQDKESPSGNDSGGVANPPPHAPPVQSSMPMLCCWKKTGRSAQKARVESSSLGCWMGHPFVRITSSLATPPGKRELQQWPSATDNQDGWQAMW